MDNGTGSLRMAQLAIIGMDNQGLQWLVKEKVSIGQSGSYPFLQPRELTDLACYLEKGLYPFMEECV